MRAEIEANSLARAAFTKLPASVAERFPLALTGRNTAKRFNCAICADFPAAQEAAKTI
jgi:hypothetical protein